MNVKISNHSNDIIDERLHVTTSTEKHAIRCNHNNHCRFAASALYEQCEQKSTNCKLIVRRAKITKTGKRKMMTFFWGIQLQKMACLGRR